MKKNFLLTTLVGMLIFLVASCASAPADAPNPLDSLEGAKAAAQEIRTKALEIKADIAVPLLFTEADNTFSAAQESEAMDETLEAHEEYKSAVTQFTLAFNEAEQKKTAALKALDTADQERKTSEDLLEQIAEEQKSEEEAN